MFVAALFRETRCWEDWAWPRRGARAVELFGRLSCGPLRFCGEVERIIRLAYRIGAPLALLDEGRRCVIREAGRRLT